VRVPSQKQAGERGAASVIELLVVVGVLLALVALAFPSVQALRSRSHTASCMGNLRGIFHASLAYHADHNGQWPPTHASSGGLPFTTSLADYLGPYPPTSLSGWNRSPVVCPADRYHIPDKPGKEGVYQVGSPKYGLSYAQNGYLTNLTAYFGVGPRPSVAHPSKLAVYMDWEQHYIAEWSTLNGDAGQRKLALMKRHSGNTHVIFADGHLEAVPITDIPNSSPPPTLFWTGRDSGQRP